MRSGIKDALLRTLKVLIIALCVTTPHISALKAHATDSCNYKPNEYLVISDGLSPNHRFSIRTGEDAKGDFHGFLFAEPKHKRIGPLEEISDPLDTGPGSYEAVWSPDSRHVAISYRGDRHILEMRLYGIENRRAYPVGLPNLMVGVCQKAHVAHGDVSGVLPGDVQAMPGLRSEYIGLTWHDSRHFELHQVWVVFNYTPAFGRATKAFCKTVTDAPEGTETHTIYEVSLAAKSSCQLVSGDRCQVGAIVPGSLVPTERHARNLGNSARDAHHFGAR